MRLAKARLSEEVCPSAIMQPGRERLPPPSLMTVRPPAPSGAPLAQPTRSTEHDRVTAAATTDPAGHPQRLQPLRALRPRPCRPRRRRRRLRCALPARAASMASPRPTRTIAAVQSCSEPAGQLRRRSTRRPAEPRNSAPRPAPLAPPSAGAGLHGRSPAGRRPLARPRTTPPRALEETSPLAAPLAAGTVTQCRPSLHGGRHADERLAIRLA